MPCYFEEIEDFLKQIIAKHRIIFQRIFALVIILGILSFLLCAFQNMGMAVSGLAIAAGEKPKSSGGFSREDRVMAEGNVTILASYFSGRSILEGSRKNPAQGKRLLAGGSRTNGVSARPCVSNLIRRPAHLRAYLKIIPLTSGDDEKAAS